MKTKREMIFDANRPTPSCHASTVLPLDGGDVLAAWFGGSAEGKDDVDIWLCRRSDGKWGEPKRISAHAEIPHWNPALFEREDGTVVLYFKVGKDIPLWQTYFVESTDGGKTFSSPKWLVENDMSGGRGPVKNKPIRLSDGRVLAPASTEQNREWKAFVDMSFDDGRSFEKQMIVPAKDGDDLVHCIQPTLWESEAGKVHMLLRTSSGFVYRSDSEDYGKTWCDAYKTALLNNNSGIDVTRDKSGALWLVSNPVGKNWGDRTPITLQTSVDNGATWETALTLEPKNDPDEEFSYPAIVCKGNSLYITYTFNREKIAYWEIEL